MSQTETTAQQSITRSNFASRMLTKELNVRKKATEESKMPQPPAEGQKKETSDAK